MSVIPLVVLLSAVVAVAAIAYRIRRTRWSDRGHVVSGVGGVASAPVSRPGGRHRVEDAHTGCLSATAILHALNARAADGDPADVRGRAA